MTITILIPLLVCFAGIVLYALSANPAVKEVGRTMMWTGMLVTLMHAQGTVRF
jgi:hypothetical protein